MDEHHLRDVIMDWRRFHKDDPTRGFDELMSVVKQVYERDLVQMENVKYNEAQPDEDKFKRVGEAVGADLAQRIDEYTAKQKLMTDNRLTVNQADILLHSLGHPKYYRNYFAASSGTQDWSDIQVLVRARFMGCYQARDHDSGLQYYRVTDKGKDRMEAAGFVGAARNCAVTEEP